MALIIHIVYFIIRAKRWNEVVDNQQGKRGAKWLIVLQIGMTLLISAVAAALSSMACAYSMMLGGLVSVLPNLYFARAVFRYQGARAAKKIVNTVYKGEAFKLILSMALFTLVFVVFKVDPVPFFISYIAAQMVFWFSPLIFAAL